jgi:Tfp pilus assembly protein PilV
VNKNSGQSGFSLIEVMMFVSMLVAVVYGSSAVLTQGSRQAAQERHRWNATELGSMIMEELAFSYMSAGQLDGGSHTRLYDQNYGIVAADSDQLFYTVEWTVEENSPLQGVSNISLVVKWNEGPHGKVVTFQTYR